VRWFRTTAELDGDGVSLYSRRLNSFNGRFSPIATSLEVLGHTAVLDGEIVALDEAGHPRFEWLFHRGKGGKGQLVYFVFDLLYLDGTDLRREPLHRRKSRLKRIIRKLPHVIYVDHVEEHGEEFFALASKLGLEGIIGKDKRSVYVSGRETRD
jgi:bifunctional non-homologous end joining protein LigD